LIKLKQALELISNVTHRGRTRFSFKNELVLAALPTLTVLVVLFLIETFARQRILFASLASSAFLIYRDPHNQMNSLYSLLVSQTGAAAIGLASYLVLGSGYGSAGAAMIVTVIFMVALDAIHPPAVATAISFGFSTPDTNIFFLFLLALIMVAVLVLLEQVILWLVRRADIGQTVPQSSPPD
jgi:CBS-domain-containing membrane protein